MGNIYVDVGPMDVSKAPKPYADRAKAAMRKGVADAVKGVAGFTVTKGEGYQIRLKVAELKIDGAQASCKLTGELVRYPKQEMVSTSLAASTKASGGRPDALVADCIDGAVEGIMTKAIPVMRQQAR
jgi:hypothetical protein